MDWNNFYNGNNNATTPVYNYHTPMHYELIQVNGRAGAESFRMAPNSSAVLVDTTGAIIWFARTDGAGYLTVEPYDITPHKEKPPINVEDIDTRLKKLEDYIAQQQQQKKPQKEQGK